jgi:hypothetical protein
MSIDIFLKKLSDQKEKIMFEDVLAVIDASYDFTPSDFSNGNLVNRANHNNGSCKVFAFANLHKLDEQATLNLFGQYYRDVIGTPEGDDHQNIRNFMNTGWPKITFVGVPLSEK